MTDIRKSSAFVPHDLRAPIRGAARGPLAGLTLAVKDMYDIAGERTGAGNPDWLACQIPATTTASAVQRLLDAGAELIGKTVCDEFFFSLAGINAHYGMPANPRALGRLPGGSSSGSAAATASGACDIALGSDTGGSVRVPASFCGIYGIRPSHGRVDALGAMAMAPSFDTVGWFAAGPGLLRKVGEVLLDPHALSAPVERLLLARDCFAQADDAVEAVLRDFLARAASRLPQGQEIAVAPAGFERWRDAFRVIQGREMWAIYGDWMTAHKPTLGPGIRERIAYTATVTAEDADAARRAMDEARAGIRAQLPKGTVLALPTAPCIAPRADATAEELDHFRIRAMTLTCIAGLSGLPQVTLPAGTVAGCPVGLSFIGWSGADEALLNLAATLAPFCGG
ncbi:MAG TPA: amidase [Stellaceae bacterium]|nr:amidase [Stellaceae bacterium]